MIEFSYKVILWVYVFCFYAIIANSQTKEFLITPMYFMQKQIGGGVSYEFSPNGKLTYSLNALYLRRAKESSENNVTSKMVFESIRIVPGVKKYFNFIEDIQQSIGIVLGINFSNAWSELPNSRASGTQLEIDPGINFDIVRMEFDQFFLLLSYGASYKFTNLDYIPFEDRPNTFTASGSKNGINQYLSFSIGYIFKK